MSEIFDINEKIFDGLELDPDGAVFAGMSGKDYADSDTVRKLTFLRLGIAEKPRRSGMTAKRILMIAAAAAIAAGVIFAGSSMVLGHDNYDPYSDEAKAVKAQLQSEYQSKYDQKLDELIARKESGQENDQDQNGTSNARWTAAHEMNMAVLKILQTGHVFIDPAFSESDIYQKKDEFINACCDAYVYGNLSTEDKTRIFIYLKGQTQTKDPYSGTYHERCSDQSYEKISETLKGYLDPPEHYTLEQLNELAKNFHKTYTVKDVLKPESYEDEEEQLLTFDQNKLDNEYRMLEARNIYKDWPEVIAAAKERDKYDNRFAFYLKNELGIYKRKTGINVLSPDTYEANLAYSNIFTDCIAHFVGEYANEMVDILEGIDPEFDKDPVDVERMSTDYDYMCEEYIRFYHIILNNKKEITPENKAIIERFFILGYMWSRRIKAREDMGFCIGDSYLEAYRTKIPEILGITKEQLIAKYS